MVFRTLSEREGTGTVALPKDDLRRDGLVNDDGSIRDQQLFIDRLDKGTYLLRATDSIEEVPELRDYEAVRRAVLEKLMEMGQPINPEQFAD